MKTSFIFGLLFSLLLGNALSQTPTILIDHYVEEPGTQVEIFVEVSNFTEVAAISLFFSYDDDVLEFVEYKDPALTGMTINAFTDFFTGIPQIGITWSETFGAELPDGNLVTIVFDYISGTSDFTFLDTSTLAGIVDGDVVELDVTFVDGSITDTGSIGVNVFLEGLYNSSTGQMNKAKDFDTGTNSIVDKFPGTIADLITVELHEPGNYGTPAYIIEDVELHQDGTATVDLPPGATGSYYLTIRHRNHLETVSADPIDLASVNSYDFTNSDSKAFGENMLEVSTGVWAIYAGDIDDNGLINILDLNPVIDSIRSNEKGYIIEDINGDGLLNILDTNIIINNIRNNINSVTPN